MQFFQARLLTDVRDYRPPKSLIAQSGLQFVTLGLVVSDLNAVRRAVPLSTASRQWASLKAFEGLGPAQSAEPFVAANPSQDVCGLYVVHNLECIFSIWMYSW